MALLYKRKDGKSPYWHVTKTRQSTGTINRKDAEEFARKVLNDHWRDASLGDTSHTFDDLARMWLDKKSSKRSLKDDIRIINDAADWLRRRELLDKDLSKITADHLAGYAAFVRARASASTANKHLAILRAMLKKAAGRDWITKVPVFEMYVVPKKTIKHLSHEEFANFITYLPEPIRDIAVFGVQTGLRMGNIFGLKWDWVNDSGTVIHVPIEEAKTEIPYTVALSEQAKKIIAKRLQFKLSSDGYVFTKPGTDQPYRSIRFWWDKAREDSGLLWANPHKLRHTWASWHTRAGTPDRIIQASAGWTTPAMLQKYAHLVTGHLEEYADNLNKQVG